MSRHDIPPYAGTDCSGCGKYGDDCWRELRGDTCCVACRDEETNGHHIEGVDRASGEPLPGRCLLCAEDMPAPFGPREMLDHIRVNHPDQYEEPERWPDGGIVVYEGDLDAGAEAMLRGDA